MKERSESRFYHRRIFADPAGVILIILAGLLGWLPGPGGMPLLYAGLRMLALNNKWAQDLLDYLLREGLEIIDRLFPDHRVIMLLWDIVVIIFIGLGLYAIFEIDNRFASLFTTALIIWAVVAFFSNRKRFVRLKARRIRK